MIAFAISNKFTITDDCHNALVKYSGDNNQYGFVYGIDSARVQQVRLGLYISNDTQPKTQKVYRKTNGRWRRGNTIIENKVILNTDQVDAQTREALTVALSHDNLTINGVDYFTIGDVTNEPNEFNNLANVTTELYEQGYNQTNMSC